MKQILLATLLVAGTSTIALAGTETVHVVINGARTQGTKVETTRHRDGSISISADCTGTYGECASATYTITTPNSSPQVGDQAHIEFYNPNGIADHIYNGTFVSQSVYNTDHGKAFSVTINGL